MDHRLYKPILSIWLTASLCACAAAKKDIRLSPEPRPTGAGLPAYTAPAPMSAMEKKLPHPEAPSETITLEDARARALMHNPELAASSWEVRSGEARTDQARRYPNPELEVEIEEFGGSREEEGSGRSTPNLF